MSEESKKFHASITPLPPIAQYAKADGIDVWGDSAEEFASNLRALTENEVAQAFAEAVGTMRAVAAASGLVVAAQPASGGSQAASGSSASAPQGGSTGGSGNGVPDAVKDKFKAEQYTCAHGDRVYRSGNGKNGTWHAMFCPLPQERKSEQCAAEWAAK